MNYWIELMGWAGTLVLLVSYFLKERLWLHWIALIACLLKLVYTYEHEVWPLFANWVVLIPVHIWQVWSRSGGDDKA